MKLAIDLDGTVAQHVARTIQIAKELGFVDERVTAGDWKEYFNPGINGLSLDLCKWIWAHTDCFRTCTPEQTAIRGLMVLSVNKIDIDIVTDRFSYRGLQADTIDWLNRYNIPYNTVHFIKAGEKPAFVKALGYDMLIEDRTDTAVECARVGIPSSLIEKSYNQDYLKLDLDDSIPVARTTWNELVPILVNLKKQE